MRAHPIGPTRRELLAGASALGASLALALAPRAADAELESLATIARASGRFFGAAVQTPQLLAERDLRETVLAQCDVLVPEIAMTWTVVEPTQGELDFAPMDALVAFASAHGKRVHGHNLLWGLSVPGWADDALRETADWSIVSRYFGSIIPRYGDAVHEWNVVNETIDTGHRMDGLRENVFLDVFGPDYIPRALHEARTFAPTARLLVNEYGLEYDTQEQRDRRYLLLQLLRRLRSVGAPLDGLGMQSHLELRYGQVSAPALNAFFDDVASLGLTITITELDVKEYDLVASPQERDRLVGDAVARYLDVALAHPAVTGIVTWGLSDRHSWLTFAPADLARFPGAWRSGGGPGLNRGLPFDAAMAPTPMFSAIARALRDHPRGTAAS